jgi:hypothetical protein
MRFVFTRFYNWNVASALIASTSVYHKQLPAETIEQLQERHMIQTKPRTTSGGSSWWPFYGKKYDVTNKNVKSEALAQVAKSEIVETVVKNQNFIRHNS